MRLPPECEACDETKCPYRCMLLSRSVPNAGTNSLGAALNTITPQCKPQRPANFLHARRTQLRHASSQLALPDRDNVMQIHRTRPLQAIVLAQDHFRRDPTNGRGDRHDRHGSEMIDHNVSCEDNDRPGLVRRLKTAQTDLTASYSSGHTALPSHSLISSRFCGCLL